MRVLYDISVLGLGHCVPRARTGVFRVVENVALGLAESPSVSLSFCAPESLENTAQAIGYLTANPNFQRIEFSASKSAAKVRDRLVTHLHRLNSKPTNTIAEKVMRRVLFNGARAIEKTCSPLPGKSLARSQIFHSPYHPLPAQVRAQKHLKRFLTVYDLIEILRPEFFPAKQPQPMKSAVDQIESDDWSLCISEATKRDLCEYRTDLDPSRVLVTPLAASKLFYPCEDHAKIAERKKAYKIPSGPYILSLCTLEPRKNIAHTIGCFAQLVEQEKIKELSLVLVGTKGWDFDAIFEKLAAYPWLRDRVIVTGFLADQDLAPLYSGATAFVYPSFYEGFGLPPLEAMQCGVPVITSNTSSLPEVVGDAGLMVAPTDGDALCAHMLAIYRSKKLRDDLSEKCRKRATHFSWEQTTALTVAAYTTALNG